MKWIREGSLGWLIFITTVMGFVVSGDLIGIIYKSVQSEKVKSWLLEYMDICTIVKNLIPNSNIRLSIFGLIILAWFAIFYFRWCYDESMKKSQKIIHILGHSTLGKTQFRLDEKSSQTVELNIDELDLIEDMKKIDGDYDELNYVINKQDIFIEKFKEKINNNDRYGYMGISHTPLILRAGYQIGDETRFAMFHKKRNMNYYEELDDSGIYVPINIEKKEIKDNCEELIVAVSTTFPIEDYQLNILQTEDKSILKFKTDDMGFDVITSEKQVEDYVRNILKEMRQIVREKEITKIHMVISSSIAFTFAMGQAISSHYDPEIIIYHFDINKPKQYPWGISLFEDYKKCAVVN